MNPFNQDEDDEQDANAPAPLAPPQAPAAIPPVLPPDPSQAQAPAAPQFGPPAPPPAGDPSDLMQKLASSPSVSPELQALAAKKLSMADFSPEKRQALVDQGNSYDTTGAISGALAALGAGIQGRDSVAAANNVLNQRRIAQDDKLKQFDQSRKSFQDVEANDPNSDTSKRFRATLKANFPDIADKYGDAFDSLTAADQKSVFNVAETKAKLEGAQAQRGAVLEMRKAQMQAHQDALDDRKQKQLSDQDNKDAQALEKHLDAGWTARSGQAGIVQGKINAAQRAQALLDQAKTQQGGLDSRQIEELAQSTGQLIGAGTPASARIEALVPHTFWGRTQSLKEYLSNNPTGQGMQAFTDRLGETIAREKNLAEQQKRQYQVEGLAAHSRLKKSNPDLYNQMLQEKGIDPSMINSKGQYQQPPETKQINGKTYKKVPGGWQAVDDMQIGQNNE